MAKNDVILLDGILQERAKTESLDAGTMFELFAFEQILKSYDLDRSEIDSGWVDGKDDGGIDGYYTFVNGALVQDVSKFSWPKKSVTIDVVIINCKHKDSFQQAPLNTIFPTLEELLDFGKGPEDFDAIYAEALIKARQKTVAAFLRTASSLPKLNFRLVYASRGDIVEPNIEARGAQLKRIISEYFSDAEVALEFLGASELVSLYRKKKFVLTLPFEEQLSGKKGAYVLLVSLKAYSEFVKDERGDLRRYLFDSNVRDFLGTSRVNQDIFDSLSDRGSPDFWWLNNGVTILATSAIPLGKTEQGNAFQLHDVQIVNGLQTTQTIHNYFSGGLGEDKESRSVLVKIVVSGESEVRDRIIRATNNQTSVELSSLAATDKVQRDIEEILERHSWYYERRKNHYKNVGKPVERFVHPMYLTVGLVALVKKSPQLASRLRVDFMHNPVRREAVFSEKVPLLLWPKLVEVMKKIDDCTSRKMKETKFKQKNYTAWKGAIALCVVSEIFRDFNYTLHDFLGLDASLINDDKVKNILSFFAAEAVKLVVEKNSKARSEMICERFALANDIQGFDVVGRWNLPSIPVDPESSLISNTSKYSAQHYGTFTPLNRLLTSELLTSLKDNLPQQPWKPGTQQEVANRLGIPLKVAREGIYQLIKSGSFNDQINGVVVNKEGIIVALDSERADKKYNIGDYFDIKKERKKPSL